MQLFLGALMIQVLLINDFTLLYKQEHYDKKLFSCISFNMTNFMQKIHCTCIMSMYEKTVFCTSMDTIQLCGQNNIQLNVFSDLSKHKREMAMLWLLGAVCRGSHIASQLGHPYLPVPLNCLKSYTMHLAGASHTTIGSTAPKILTPLSVKPTT